MLSVSPLVLWSSSSSSHICTSLDTECTEAGRPIDSYMAQLLTLKLDRTETVSPTEQEFYTEVFFLERFKVILLEIRILNSGTMCVHWTVHGSV